MAETSFATLKTELIYTRSWSTRHELESEVFGYIEGFYNPRRRHSRLRNLSPAYLRAAAPTDDRHPGVRLKGVTSLHGHNR
jgi:transposase InsO family protein